MRDALISADWKRKGYRKCAELERAEKVDEDNWVDRSNNRIDK
jgi:hypothetical protein